MNKCPKCGDDQGIEYDIWVRKSVVMQFNGVADTSSYSSVTGTVKEPKTGRCINCNTRIKISHLTQ